MFEARQCKRFVRRMEILKENLLEIGIELKELNTDLKNYSEVLSKSLENSEGRKESRLLSESDKCDDLLDKVDDLALSIGVEFEVLEPSHVYPDDIGLEDDLKLN